MAGWMASGNPAEKADIHSILLNLFSHLVSKVDKKISDLSYKVIKRLKDL